MERVDLAVYSRQLRRQAVWCGLVFSLAALFSVLNALPPVPVRYEVTGKILVEPQRIEGLVRNLKRSTSWSEPTVLRDFQVLARSSVEQATDLTRFHGSDRVFLMIKSLWQRQCSLQEFSAWADSATKYEGEVNRDSDLAAKARLARWELATAEHYKKHHEFLSTPARQSSDSTASSSVTSLEQQGKDSAKFQFAGLDGKPSPGYLVASTSDGGSNAEPEATEVSFASDSNTVNEFAIRKQLETNVAVAHQRVEELAAAIDKSLARLSGEIEIFGVPQVVPVSDRIPTWMALSVVVILVTTGGLAGAYYFRLQSGGVYDPSEVAVQLASQSLPMVAIVQLPADQLDSSDWLELAVRQASGAGRRTAKNLIRLSETVLAFWCLTMLARCLFDPMWRTVLIDSPLAAFSRLITGLP